jgi:1,4-dihydroxy-2-naphthoate octaprenyltransferase
MRSRGVRVIAVVAALIVVGLVLIGVSDATAVDIAGIVLVGTGLVLAVAAIFYEVGASEDRERAETERRRRGGGGAGGP